MPWGVAAAAVGAAGSIYSAKTAASSASRAADRASREAAAERARVDARTFTAPLGTATSRDFTYNPAAGTAQTTTDARSQLGGLVAGGLGVDPAAASQYQQAFLGSRLPQLQQQQAQQQQSLQAQIGATGLTGSSGAIMQQALRQQFANQQTAALQNQAVIGGRDMAVQDAGAKQAQAGFLQGLSQQDVQNLFSAQSAAEAARLGNVSSSQQAGNSAVTNALAARTLSQNVSSRNLQNLTSGIAAGFKVGNSISDGYKKPPAGGGGGGGTPSSLGAGGDSGQAQARNLGLI